MKRFLSLMLCLILVTLSLSLVACDETTLPAAGGETTTAPEDDDSSSGNKTPKEGVDILNGKTPKELYDLALEKVAALTNYEVTANQVITVSYDGQLLQTINQVVISQVDGQTQYVKSTNDADSSSNMEIWYVNDWLYTTMGGNSIKANITWQQMQDNFMPEGSDGSNALLFMPESWFKNIKFEKDGDLYFIEFTISGEDYIEYVKNSTLTEQAMSADDITYIVYFDQNGELAGDIITKFDFKVTENGYTFDAHLESVSTISKIGEITITKPEGNFTDVTGNMNLK